MSKPIGTKTALFLNKKVSVSDFEKEREHLEFNDINATVWQFVVLKSFEHDFNYFLPLAHHLLDNNYVNLSKDVLQYAILIGYQAEISLDKMKEVESSVNKTRSEFRFDEKMVIKNQPIENILNLSKIIILKSKISTLEDTMKDIEKTKVKPENIQFLQSHLNSLSVKTAKP